jgi:hypothetical protein
MKTLIIPPKNEMAIPVAVKNEVGEVGKIESVPASVNF